MSIQRGTKWRMAYTRESPQKCFFCNQLHNLSYALVHVEAVIPHHRGPSIHGFICPTTRPKPLNQSLAGHLMKVLS